MQNDISHLNPPSPQAPPTNATLPTETDPKLSDHVTDLHTQSQNPTSESQINVQPSQPTTLANEAALLCTEKNGSLSKTQRRKARRRLLKQQLGPNTAHESIEVKRNMDNNNNDCDQVVGIDDNNVPSPVVLNPPCPVPGPGEGQGKKKKEKRKKIKKKNDSGCEQVSVQAVVCEKEKEKEKEKELAVVEKVNCENTTAGKGSESMRRRKKRRRGKSVEEKLNCENPESGKEVVVAGKECRPVVEEAICPSPETDKEIVALDKEGIVEGLIGTSPGTAVGRGSEVAVREKKKRKRGKSELVVEVKPAGQNTDVVSVIAVLDKEAVVGGAICTSSGTGEGKESEVGVRRRKKRRKRGKSELVVEDKPTGQNTDAVNVIAVLDKECVDDEIFTCQNPDTDKEIVMLDREVPVVEVPVCPSLGGTEGRESEVAVWEMNNRTIGNSELVSVKKYCSKFCRKFLQAFKNNDELRNYYVRKCESGEFYCLVCGMREMKEKMSNKLGNKFKDCVALVQHCFFHGHKPAAHRAYAYAVCQIIDWDIGPLLCCPSKVGDADASGLLLETANEVKEEVTNQVGGSAVNPTVVQGLKDTTNTVCSQVQTEDTLDSILDGYATHPDERCNSNLLGGTASKQGQTEANCTNNTEEGEKLLAVKVHLKGVKSCIPMFYGLNGGDYEEYDEVEDVKEEFAYRFYTRLFNHDKRLRGYYLVMCKNGEFYCLVCGMVGDKPYSQGRLYKNCIALLEHCVSVCQTNEREAHRGFARVVCEVLCWNIDRVLSLPSTEGNGQGPFLVESSELQDELKNVGPEDNCSVTHVRNCANTIDTILDSKVGPDAVAKDKLGSIGLELTSAHPACKNIGWSAISWSLPPQGFHKLNFDASIPANGEAVVGYIIRNSKGAIIEATTCKVGELIKSPETAAAGAPGNGVLTATAEAIALRNGVLAALNHQIRNIEIEGDSLNVIMALQGRTVLHKEEYILETRGLLHSFDRVIINHIYREANCAADWLTKQGHRCIDTAKFSPSNEDIEFFNIVLNDTLHVDVPFKKRFVVADRLLKLYDFGKKNKISKAKRLAKELAKGKGTITENGGTHQAINSFMSLLA